MPEIAVITPAYMQNDRQIDWLTEAMLSVQAQTFTDWELIIVDDASPVALEGPADGQIRLIHHDRRRGAGAARNTGLAAARSAYVLCLDADDRLKPDALQTLWDRRCAQGVIYGDLEYFGDKTGLHTLPGWNLEMLLRGTSPLPVTALHTRDAWRAVGGFDEQLPGMEDVDYWIKLAARGVCGRHIDQVIFEYRRHVDSRQAGLEADNRARMKACVEIIQARYRKIASEVTTVAANCGKCPGKGGPSYPMSNDIPAEVGAQRLLLRYTGPMRGSFRAHGFATGAKYFVNGHGDTITVDVRDAPNLLLRATGGRPDFEQLQVLPPQAPQATWPSPPAAPVSTAPRVAEVLPPTLPVIADMSAKDAVELIEVTESRLDLGIWLAEERASEKPRKSVIAAVEARLQALDEAAHAG